MDKVWDVVIIGAGPSGLALARNLDHKLSYIVLESSNQAGGAYARIEPSIRLVSPPKLCQLPGMDLKTKSKRISAGEFMNYLREYMRPALAHIRFNSKAISLKKTKAVFECELENKEVITSKTVVVATGKFSFPKTPKNLSAVKARKKIFASEWKLDKLEPGSRALVLGSGLNAYEIAAMSSLKASVDLALKERRKILPLEWMGINLHWVVRPLEKIPQALQAPCKKTIKDPVLDSGFKKELDANKFNVIGPSDVFDKEYDLCVVAAGLNFDLSILPKEAKVRDNGLIKAKKNETTVPGLFVLGQRCCGNIDSDFLRGIATDAKRLARRLNRSL